MPRGVPGPPQIRLKVRSYKNCPGLFKNCKNRIKRRAGYVPSANGCGNNFAVKGGTHVVGHEWAKLFKPCCNNHDFCYGSCGASKVMCDTLFHKCMVASCNAAYGPGKKRTRCTEAAGIFHLVVNSRLGDGAFCSAQEDACVCK